MKTVYSVCGMCGTRCPVAVGVENGEAVWIQGNPHSATGSTLCPRGHRGARAGKGFRAPAVAPDGAWGPAEGTSGAPSAGKKRSMP